MPQYTMSRYLTTRRRDVDGPRRDYHIATRAGATDATTRPWRSIQPEKAAALLTTTFYSEGGLYVDLLAAAREAATDDWDLEGGRPIEAETLENARRFIGLLPSEFPAPRMMPTPASEIAFVWSLAPRWTFSVSVGPSKELAFAGLFDTEPVDGRATLGGDLPRFVRLGLERFAERVRP